MLSIKNILKIILYVFIFFKVNLIFPQPIEVLINKILKKDESINSSKIFLEKANNDLSSVTSLYTPKLDVTMPLGREILINNDSPNTDYDYYEISAKISQNIYDFGQTSSKYKKAKNQVKLAEISKENTKSNKIFEAIAAYLGYMKAFEVLEYAIKSEERIRTVTKLENEKVARGGGLASNVLQSKARLAGAKATRVRFEGDLSIATNRFYNIFRELPEKFSTFNRPNLPINLLPKTEKEAIKLAKQNNISLNLSKINLKNSETSIKGAKSKFFPSIKAIAEYKNKRNMSGLDGTEIDHVYKIEMKYPISIGGKYGIFYKENSDYKSSLNQYMISKYGHQQLERNLEETIRNAWQTKKISKQNYEYLSNQANISGEFFDLAMKEVKLGNRQLIDILSSETAYINAKSAAESAKTQYELSVYQLILSMGILNEAIFSNKRRGIDKSKSFDLDKDSKKQEKIKRKAKAKISKVSNNHILLKAPVNLKTKKAKNIITTNLENKNEKQTAKKLTNVKLLKTKDYSKFNKPKEYDIHEKKISIENTDIRLNNENFYKLQFGAFRNIKNAKKLLDELKDFNLGNVKVELENQEESKLYKIKSISKYSEQKAKDLCKDFKNLAHNCILSKI